jgi:hypothetical protein
VEVRLQRLGDLLAKEGSQRGAGEPAHDLADQIALSDRVVTGPRTGRPEGRLGGEKARHLLPVVEVLVADRFLPPRQSRSVAHQVADLDVRLAVGGELRPVAGDRGVEIELAAISQNESAKRRHRLGRRIDVDDHILLPGSALRGVGKAAPKVDDRLPFQGRAERGADVCSAGEIVLEHRAGRGEPVVGKAGNGAVGHGCPPCLLDSAEARRGRADLFPSGPQRRNGVDDPV